MPLKCTLGQYSLVSETTSVFNTSASKQRSCRGLRTMLGGELISSHEEQLDGGILTGEKVP